MLPATKAVPKELLPLGEMPALQLVIDEAIGAGVVAHEQCGPEDDHRGHGTEQQLGSPRMTTGGALRAQQGEDAHSAESDLDGRALQP